MRAYKVKFWMWISGQQSMSEVIVVAYDFGDVLSRWVGAGRNIQDIISMECIGIALPIGE